MARTIASPAQLKLFPAPSVKDGERMEDSNAEYAGERERDAVPNSEERREVPKVRRRN